MIPPKSASIAVKQAFFVGGRLTSASLLSRVAITVYIVDSKNLEQMIYQVDIPGSHAIVYFTAVVGKQVNKCSLMCYSLPLIHYQVDVVLPKTVW